jgi:hypothetical protein
MVESPLFQRFVVLLFTLANGALLYLFLLQLPYSLEALKASFVHWNDLRPSPAIMMALSIGVMIVALATRASLSDQWKNRLLYFRKRYAHPAHRSFVGGKDPGFDLAPLKKLYPQVHDSAYDPQVQFETWLKLLHKHRAQHVISNPEAVAKLLGDVYVLSLIFLAAFLFAWPLSFGIVFQIAAPYLFLFGAQAIFLLFSAKGADQRLVVNVLALEAGFAPDGEKAKPSKKPRR